MEKKKLNAVQWLTQAFHTFFFSNCVYARKAIFHGPTISNSAYLYPIFFTISFPLSECGRTLQEPSGTFASPGFPKSRKFKLCEWRISVTPGERISLNFTAFGLRRGSGKCRDEYVEVRDGHSRTAPLIGRYCGRKMPPAIWSTGSRLWIRYSSGEATTRQGFKATYKGESCKKY